VGREIRTIMITSSLPDEGKTTIVQLLGRGIAESGKRVVLVDMDYRRQGLTRRFDALRHPGLTNVALDRVKPSSALISTETAGLSILPTGPIPEPLNSFLQSPCLKEAIASLSKVADVVLLDVPPLVVTDALFLARGVDGIVLVAVPGQT